MCQQNHVPSKGCHEKLGFNTKIINNHIIDKKMSKSFQNDFRIDVIDSKWYVGKGK